MTDDEIKALVTGTIKTAIDAAVKPLTDGLAEAARNQKILADTYADDKKKADDAAKAAATAAQAAEAEKAKAAAQPKQGEAAKPLAIEDVAKLLTDTLAKRDEAAQSSAARNAFVAEKLTGVPAPYAALLGNDPAKWAAEEQALRAKLKADLTAMGATVKEVAGGSPGGSAATTAAAAAADPAKVAQMKAAGLSDGAAEFAAALKIPA